MDTRRILPPVLLACRLGPAPRAAGPASVEPITIALALPQGLLQPVDAAPQLVDLPLTGQSEIQEQLVAVALELPLRLLLHFRGFPPDGLEHIIHQGRGLVGIQSAAQHPVLAHVAEAVGHQRGGAEAAQQQHLQQIALIHGGVWWGEPVTGLGWGGRSLIDPGPS